MAANFLHGAETLEVEYGPRAIRVVKSAVIGLIGTAPTGPINELTLCPSENAGAQFGPRLSGFSIPKALKAIYDHGAGTVLVINVLNPEIHQTEATGITVTFGINNRAMLPHAAIISAKVKTAETTYVQDTDYTLNLVTGELVRLTTGAIPARATVTVEYIYADPSKVTPADIIGAVDAAGHRSGINALEDAYNLYGFFAKLLIAPGFSTLNSVGTELISAAHKYGAMALIDAPVGTTPSQAISGRGPMGTINFATSSERAILCYPHLKVYDSATDSIQLEPMSQRLAGLMAAKDLERGYWWSPSNTEFKGIVGSERSLSARIDDPNSEVNLLNENGIVTVFNSFGTGLRSWGNRSAAWPSVTHMKNFISVRRVKDIVDESIRYSSLQFIDMPITQAVIDAIVESVNQFLRKLIGDGALLGGECWYDPERNPQTQLELGNALFQYKLTPPPPMERITYESEITGEYLATLKGGN
ncbi:phage tail sheath subtilisin-like domain-containing protein [Budviciaceae bacterium BWR-B9]|uniref:Phage tail sheath subtilisin-like domain-containing protein n=1 Tax=Limnobaculum allomyrinae TaxID=2791986 RepID=A0ABS1IVZ3_9GAMM|nr:MULTISPECIES: phage tail sheath subtilisin-like domain-containing protein [Limnobaculum]MBK5145938.1 phage tail sheath subtilisin-like domain-containing protein [Limnobaculum allomyrinae]MBV7694007.1 phage tail sheath subtilisin-like domain-containing protein [Limnobaculum sp. M2-1]